MNTPTRPPIRVTACSPSFGTYGGIQAVMLAIAQATEGDVDTRIALKLVGDAAVLSDLNEAIATTRTPVRILRPSLASLVRALRGSDIVHLHTPSLDLAVAARLVGARLAITIHNNEIVVTKRRRVQARAALALAHRVWFISDFVGGAWGLQQRPPRVEKVPNVSRLPSGPTAPGERRGFVVVSRMIDNKGLPEILEAYASADIDRVIDPLVVVGTGELHNDLTTQAERLGIKAHVDFAGFLGDEARDARIRQARWLIAAPNTSEDLGLTPIEAAAVGVPSIVSRDGGLPEAAGPYALICEPGDVGSLRARIEEASSHSAQEYDRRSAAVSRHHGATLRTMEWFAGAYIGLVGEGSREGRSL